MGYSDFVNRLSATKFGGALTRATAAKVDPWIYKRTKGRWVMAGRPTIPQLTLTTIGRRSGQRREVQLAFGQIVREMLGAYLQSVFAWQRARGRAAGIDDGQTGEWVPDDPEAWEVVLPPRSGGNRVWKAAATASSEFYVWMKLPARCSGNSSAR